MTSSDAPRRPWPNAQERAWVYREQLAEIRRRALRERFLETIMLVDPAAYELIKDEDKEKHDA